MPETTNYVLGTLGGILVTIALLPQLIKVWMTRSVADLSFLTYILYALGVLMWFFYGFHKNDWLLSFFKACGFVLSVCILIGIWKFSPENPFSNLVKIEFKTNKKKQTK